MPEHEHPFGKKGSFSGGSLVFLRFSPFFLLAGLRGHSLRGEFNGVHDFDVPRTPAVIAVEGFFDSFFGGVWFLFQKSDARQDHCGRAKPTLHGSAFNKRFLNGMERITLGDPLNRLDFGPIGPNGRDETGAGKFVVQQHRTTPAHPNVTPYLCPG
jgi:hypothetical protein